MIGFNELGRKGNLGNQMFQFASLRGIAANRKFDWRIPPQDKTRIHDYALFRYFELPTTKGENVSYVNFATFKSPSGDKRNSTGFEFDDDLFNGCPDNVNLNGFFQTEKYFSAISDLIRKEFTFKEKYLDLIEQSGLNSEPFTSLHVRRGDYLNSPKHHPVLSEEYYRAALENVEDLPIIVFTNDKDWVRSSSFLKNVDYRMANFEDYGLDLCLMTMARQSIIANSSFSWWGSWLSDSEAVIAPKLWFGPKLAHQDTSDLIPSNWTRL